MIVENCSKLFTITKYVPFHITLDFIIKTALKEFEILGSPTLNMSKIIVFVLVTLFIAYSMADDSGGKYVCTFGDEEV